MSLVPDVSNILPMEIFGPETRKSLKLRMTVQVIRSLIVLWFLGRLFIIEPEVNMHNILILVLVTLGVCMMNMLKLLSFIKFSFYKLTKYTERKNIK